MDHAIYTAMGAASQTLNQQAVTASNLANASTPGFRAQLNALRAVPVDGLSLATRTLVTASTPGADMTPGQLDYTSRPLDVALQQDGWLVVQAADGAEGYTRNGNIQVGPTGQLTIQGHPVIGEGGPISALNPGDPPNTVAPVGRLKLVKAEGNEVQRSDDGLFRLTAEAQAERGAVLAADPSIRIMSGVLEGSNVKPVEAMTDMIANARRFEMQMKVITSVDENEGRANQLLSMS
ncbi:flagellar basal body rod protein FlgF [Salmonella enterica subsp. enterica serovar Brandenburg]|nr:flagellar basal body rod protein FlgF [Salmonella enterica subsp. enterica serovar Brandenburg]EBM8662637.1 flagellar basal body rod protein FlgF [Salmonella enterica subsp. enterica serovar Brandenburg]